MVSRASVDRQQDGFEAQRGFWELLKAGGIDDVQRSAGFKPWMNLYVSLKHVFACLHVSVFTHVYQHHT